MAESARKTLSFITEGESIIYEATFIYNDVLAALDILVKDLEGWKAYEVKSSTKVSDTYIKDAHDRFAILVFPPVDDPNDSGQYNLIDGMPINDADYKDQLYLLFDIGDSQETYAAVKIVHWDQSRYQLWVDKTQMYEYTPEEPGGASEGPDLIVKTESHFNTFFTLSGDGYKEFHVRYLDNPEKIGFADSEFDSQYELGSDFDSDYTAVKQTAWQTALSDLGYSTSEEENSVYAYQIFTDAERAPYEYYSDDSEGIIRTAYDALNDDDGGSGVNSNFTSYYDHEVEENDAAREVRVLRSDRVREFAKEFKALLNK